MCPICAYSVQVYAFCVSVQTSGAMRREPQSQRVTPRAQTRCPSVQPEPHHAPACLPGPAKPRPGLSRGHLCKRCRRLSSLEAPALPRSSVHLPRFQLQRQSHVESLASRCILPRRAFPIRSTGVSTASSRHWAEGLTLAVQVPAFRRFLRTCRREAGTSGKPIGQVVSNSRTGACQVPKEPTASREGSATKGPESVKSRSPSCGARLYVRLPGRPDARRS